MRLFERQQLLQGETLLTKSQYAAFHAFEEKISNSNHKFPCIPAIQGNRLNEFRYGFVQSIDKDKTVEEVAALLKQFSELSRDIGSYTSLIIFFESPNHQVPTIQDYELLFWRLLSEVKKEDRKVSPETVPQSPSSPLWEFSFNEESYFVYSATPEHKYRKSRSFPCFMLAFTPRWAFERLQQKPSANKIKQKIRERLVQYDSVPPHPELKTYGEEDNYEYKQYFLRDDQSSLDKCPFHSSIDSKE